MNYSTVAIWAIIIVIGLLTFCLRFSFIVGMGYFDEPKGLKRLLQYVPASALAALTIGGLFLKQGHVVFDWRDPRYPAALLAGWVAWKTKSILWTILSGMGMLWFGQWLWSFTV